MHNCDLVNLEDMLQNGTVISGTMIEKPHSFSTACNIATQIIAQVASNQYGGQSISLAHLAPFVDVSREKIRKEVSSEQELVGMEYPEDVLNEIVERRLKKEITKGVQTIEYQVITLMTTNGQAPFLTVFMYLNEAKNEREKKELKEKTLKELDYIIPASARIVDSKHDYKVNKNMLEYTITVQTSENIANVYSLSKAEAENMIREQNTHKEGEEVVPSNPEKRPINDIRNEFENTNNKEDDNKDQNTN